MNKHILNKYFDNIYVLYISEFESDRMKYKLINKKIDVQYYMGVDGQKELKNEFSEYNNFHDEIQSRHFIKTPGAFGHLHSFIKIINDAIQKKYKKILILEPDIYFDKNFDHIVEKYLVKDYKLLYLGASQHDWKFIDNNYGTLMKQGYYHPNNTCGTFAIAIDSSIFKECLDIFKEKKNPTDVSLYELQLKYKNQSYVAFPNLITCDISKSNTTNRRRSQQDMIKKFRWPNTYINFERFSYKVIPNSIYKIVIEINYYDPKKRGWFVFKDDRNDITPIIQLSNKLLLEKKYKKIENQNVPIDTYYIFIKPTVKKIYLHFENFHIDNVYFFEFYNEKNITENSISLIKSKISKFINCNDKNLSTYYKNFINELKA